MTRSAKKETAYTAIGQLNKLTAIFARRRSELAAQVGLTEQQWLMMEQISTTHFIPSLFAEERESSRAAVSKIIRQLVDKGLVNVKLDEKDARQRHYTLTTDGEQKMQTLRNLRERAINDIWMTLDHDALAGFCQFSEKLINSIETYSGKESEQ